MAEEIETLAHFEDLDEATQAREALEDAGLHPLVIDEAHSDDSDENEDGPAVYALQVPAAELEEAERVLDELQPSEEEESMETLEEWEEESDEAREAFEQN